MYLPLFPLNIGYAQCYGYAFSIYPFPFGFCRINVHFMINILTKLKWNNRLTQPACVTCHVARAVINIVAVATLGMGEWRGGEGGGTMNRCYDCHSENCHLSPQQPRSVAASARQRRPPLAGGWELRGERGNIRPRSYSLILSLLYSLHV